MAKREVGTFSYNAIRGPACGAPGSGSRSTAQSTLTYLIAAHHGGPKTNVIIVRDDAEPWLQSATPLCCRQLDLGRLAAKARCRHDSQ